MSIFRTTPVFESTIENEVEFADVYPTVESGMEIAYEAYAGISKLTAGLYIADLMTESAIFEGTQTEESATSLMEGSIKDYVKKVKDAFIKLRDKIVNWFKKISTRIFVKFMETGKFVKKYKSDILEKASKVDFYFNGFDYQESPTEVGIEAMRTLKGMVDDVIAVDNKEDNLEKVQKMDEAATKNANTNELKKYITETCRGKEKQKDIRITEAMVKKMITGVENHSKYIKTMTDFKDDTVKAINDIIKDMDKAKEGESAAVVTAKTRMANRAVTTMQAINAHCVSLMGAMYSQYGAVLKRVFNTKVAKESAEFEDSGDSLLESAMSFI